MGFTSIEDVALKLGLHVDKHKCICPFHDDSHPSLTFNVYRNRFRCFVCDAHGGVIDLVMNFRHCSFIDAVAWLKGSTQWNITSQPVQYTPKVKKNYPPDWEWLSSLIKHHVLNEPAQHFLFHERFINPRVATWCGLTSICVPTPCWRYGKPFYDAPSLLIPYFDADGRLLSVQSRYLGQEDKPRFKFPQGSNCHIYNLPVLRLLKPNEPLWITEGCSDCWAMLSSGRKAIAIPSATLLKPEDTNLLYTLHANLSTTFHMFPDQDKPGEKLFLQLREKLPQLQRHQLPEGCKDFGDYWKLQANNKL